MVRVESSAGSVPKWAWARQQYRSMVPMMTNHRRTTLAKNAFDGRLSRRTSARDDDGHRPSRHASDVEVWRLC